METLPPEIVTRVFKNLPCLILAQNLRVCKDWNAILSQNTSVWRNLELNYIKPGRRYQDVSNDPEDYVAFTMVNFYSHGTMTTVIIKLPCPLRDPRDMDHPIVFELDASRTTLKRVEVWIKSGQLIGIGSQAVFAFFRSFPSLEYLNLTGYSLREVKKVDQHPGRMNALGLHLAKAEIVWEEGDLKWLSNLKSLLVVSDTGINIGPLGAFGGLIQACSTSLVSLSAAFFPPEDPPAEFSVCLPNLESYFNLRRFRSLESIDFPMVTQVGGTSRVLSSFSLKNIKSIEMDIEGIEYVGEEEHDRSPSVEDLLQPLQINDFQLQHLKLYSTSPGHHRTSIDSLLIYLVKFTGRVANCRRLVKVYISEDQVYSLALLVVMMISRRLDSKVGSRDPCSEVILHLPSDQIEQFRVLETEFLRMKPYEAARSSIVRKLSEWDSE